MNRGNQNQKPKAIIFDLDGVLFNVDSRLMVCLMKAHGNKLRFWELFLSDKYMHLDEPNEKIIEYVRKKYNDGYKIIIVTGRCEGTQKEATLEQLKKYNIPYNEIYFRKLGDFRKDYMYKSEVISKLLEKYEIVEVWDDSKDVINELKKILPKARLKLVSHHGASYRIHGLQLRRLRL